MNGLLILIHFYFMIKISQKNIQTRVDQRQGTLIHRQNGREGHSDSFSKKMNNEIRFPSFTNGSNIFPRHVEMDQMFEML